MIEYGIGFIKTMITAIGKPTLVWLAVVFGWNHAFDFIIMQVNCLAILTPDLRLYLEDIKIILGVIISFFVLIKIILGIIKTYKK